MVYNFGQNLMSFQLKGIWHLRILLYADYNRKL